VEENRDGTRGAPIVHSKAGAAEAIHGEDGSVVDDAVITIASGDELVDIPEAVAAATVVVVDSDDEVLVPSGKGAVPAVEVDSSDESFGDADYVPSSEDVSSSEEGGSIAGVADENDDEDGEESRPPAGEQTAIVTPRPRKRKS
jgi:hypothetical protein